MYVSGRELTLLGTVVYRCFHTPLLPNSSYLEYFQKIKISEHTLKWQECNVFQTQQHRLPKAKHTDIMKH